MSTASVLGQDQIASLAGSVRGSGPYSFRPVLGRDHGDRNRDGEYRDRLRQLRNSGRSRALNAATCPTPEAQSKTSSPTRCSGPPTIGPREPPQSNDLSIVPCRDRWA